MIADECPVQALIAGRWQSGRQKLKCVNYASISQTSISLLTGMLPTFVCKQQEEEFIENIHQIHGEQPLQNGCQRGVEKTWIAFYSG